MKNATFKIKLSLLVILFIASILRLPYLDKIPPAIYSDEASQGYNAYSILKTGLDEYGKWFPISFRSFGDWKPPLQTYAMLPTIAMLGLNEWGARLPSAIFGIATVLLIYPLSLELIDVYVLSNTGFIHANKRQIALCAAFLLCISPWHIQQSRTAMLINIELFFFTFSIYCFFKGLKKQYWWYICVVSLILSIYSYYAMRLIIPLFSVYLLVKFRAQIFKSRRALIKPFFLGLVLLVPLGLAFVRERDVVFGRAKTVSIFYDQGVELTVWDLIAQDGPKINSQVAQFLHNKPYHYTIDILRRFFQHLDGRFLFLIGDQQPPFQIPNMGPIYFIDGLFILIGLIALIKYNNNLLKFILVWIAISILPASLTFVTPAANRTYTMLMPLLFMSAIGIVWTIKKFNKPVLFTVVFILYLVSFGYFISNYVFELSENHTSWWHYGYKQIYEYTKNEEEKFSEIMISSKFSVPYIFLFFYRQIDPNTITSQIRRNYKLDEFGFEHVDSFGKYRFARNYSWEKVGERLKNALLILTPSEQVGNTAKEVHQIKSPNGSIIAKIYEIP